MQSVMGFPPHHRFPRKRNPRPGFPPPCQSRGFFRANYPPSVRNGFPMSDRVKLAREIAARTKPRFIEIKPEPRTKLRRTNDWLFITIPRERGAG
jgi:hypothetical protein